MLYSSVESGCHSPLFFSFILYFKNNGIIPSQIRIFPKTHQKANHEDFASTRKLLSAPLRSVSLQRFASVADAILRCHLQTDWNCPQIKVLPAVRKYIFSLACKLFDGTKKVERLSKYIEDISTGLLSMPIHLPGTTFNRASQKMRKEVQDVINQRKSDLSENKIAAPEDILSQILQATNEQEQFLNESDIASYIVGLLQGGYSTVNAAITIIMKYMAEYPNVYSEVLEGMNFTNSRNSLA
ncbi:dammarenediol 12-hydroxylase-like [Solanum verrucosum]|uniref:dammarenediol 12-hydroxylase-like n=1 Tax=Solanum verrucosum TaxID=315347 RepID=UPI0020D08F83|nr:dammarenediol 12-hydroxylase-like [Solanum verrucosum]